MNTDIKALRKLYPGKHFQTLTDNDCDRIALTEYEGGEPVKYVVTDEDLQSWLDADEEHSWFPVTFEGEEN